MTMKIPEGYVLVKVSELPGMIRESVRTVMKQKHIVFARSEVNHLTGGSEWQPMYHGQDPNERILNEMGRNSAAGIVLHGEEWKRDLDAVVVMSGGTTLKEQLDKIMAGLTPREREILIRLNERGASLASLEQAVEEDMRPCHGCGKHASDHPNDSGCQEWHDKEH